MTRADDVAALFEASFADAPAGVWSAPGRVNLIGEHTDYTGGFVMPLAIGQRAYVAARAPRRPAGPRSGGRSRGGVRVARRRRPRAARGLAGVPRRCRLGGRAGTRDRRPRVGPGPAVRRARGRGPVVVRRPHLRDPARHRRPVGLGHRPAGAGALGPAGRARRRRHPLRDHGPDGIAAVHRRARALPGHPVAAAGPGALARAGHRIHPARHQHQRPARARRRPVRGSTPAVRGGDRHPRRPQPAGCHALGPRRRREPTVRRPDGVRPSRGDGERPRPAHPRSPGERPVPEHRARAHGLPRLAARRLPGDGAAAGHAPSTQRSPPVRAAPA